MIAFVRRHLDPSERMSELLFGLIMTLTFTLGAGLVIEEGPDATLEMLIGITGCNIAWGIIDGLLYIFTSMYERGLGFRASTLIARKGRDAAAERLDEHLEGSFGAALSPATRQVVKNELLDHLTATKPDPVKVRREDLLGAFVTFILVTITSIPAILPFLLFDERMFALRVSNFTLIGLIGLIGWQWAASINANRKLVTFGMTVGGLILVQITIMLGG